MQSLLQFTKIICYTYVLVMSLFPYPYICFELQSVPVLFTNRRSQKTLVEHYVLVHGLFEILPSFFRIPYLKMNFHPYPYFLRIPYQGYGYGKSADPYTPFGVWSELLWVFGSFEVFGENDKRKSRGQTFSKSG